jgi:hypothetical protein
MSSLNVKKSVVFISIFVMLVAVLPNGNDMIATPTLPPVGGVFEYDIDPLVDLQITIDFLYIRGLEVDFNQNPPDFFLKLWLNGILFESPIWEDTNQVYQ